VQTYYATNSAICYATFWQRLGANLIDTVVLGSLAVTLCLSELLSREMAVAVLVAKNIVIGGYFVYCHGRWGQTLGKRAVGIRVVGLGGEPITWRQAWLRSSVDLGFIALGTITWTVALLTIANADFYGVGWLQRSKNLGLLIPDWNRWTYTASNIWFWSEVIAMLFNRQRRALHDFIAGTIVVATNQREVRTPAASPG
jgi:uncharacterized RDD family membrane protein YckC